MSEPDIAAPLPPDRMPAEPGKVLAFVRPAETWRRIGDLATLVSALQRAGTGMSP